MTGTENKKEIASKKVLIVDDDKMSTDLAEIYLKSAGISPENIVTATNGDEAVALAAQELFDVIVMDVRLPGRIGGIKASQEIRAQNKSTTPKIVAYTANAFINKDLQATEAFDGIMIKPINRENFSAKILEVLNIRNEII